MVDLCRKFDFWRNEGVVAGEVDVEKENSTLEGRIIGSRDDGLPVRRVIIVDRPRRAVGRKVIALVEQFLFNSSYVSHNILYKNHILSYLYPYWPL